MFFHAYYCVVLRQLGYADTFIIVTTYIPIALVPKVNTGFFPLVSCEKLNSTETVIVVMGSTAEGSTATYQCRDSPTDVYTTQCTSIGVWDPHLTLECTESATDPGQRFVFPYGSCQTNYCCLEMVPPQLSLTNMFMCLIQDKRLLFNHVKLEY